MFLDPQDAQMSASAYSASSRCLELGPVIDHLQLFKGQSEP